MTMQVSLLPSLLSESNRSTGSFSSDADESDREMTRLGSLSSAVKVTSICCQFGPPPKDIKDTNELKNGKMINNEKIRHHQSVTFLEIKYFDVF